MFENPRRGMQTRSFIKNVRKIVDLQLSSKQIFSENWRWVPLTAGALNKEEENGMLCNPTATHSWTTSDFCPFSPMSTHLLPSSLWNMRVRKFLRISSRKFWDSFSSYGLKRCHKFSHLSQNCHCHKKSKKWSIITTILNSN